MYTEDIIMATKYLCFHHKQININDWKEKSAHSHMAFSSIYRFECIPFLVIDEQKKAFRRKILVLISEHVNNVFVFISDPMIC